MVSRLHQRLGTAGFVLSIIALIAALAGGAYAAGGLTSAEKKQITKEAKKYSKKFSKQFAAQGPAGPAGATGPAGPKGANGTNGTNGTNGQDGETGFTEVLPAGETETGTWGLIGHGAELVLQTLSFNIPLEEAPDEIVYNEPETTDCPGTVDEPEAAAGKLCLYLKNGGGVVRYTEPPFDTLFVSGAAVAFKSESSGSAAWGTWAVTAK
jgi:hypothetical protein